MFKFYDNDFLIYKDEEKFSKDAPIREYVLTVNKLEEKMEFNFFFGEKKAPFYKLVLSENDVPEDIPISILIKNNAIFWKGNPEENPDIEVREQDEFMHRILLMMDYTNAHICPRIQLYRHGDVVACRPHMYTLYKDGIECIETDDSFADIINSYNPELKAEENIIKEELHKEAMPLNSLAYMEAQLDILSKITFALVEANDSNKKLIQEIFPGYAQFKKAVEETSVTKIKGSDKCIDELLTHKHRMRELQKDYYRKRARL